MIEMAELTDTVDDPHHGQQRVPDQQQRRPRRPDGAHPLALRLRERRAERLPECRCQPERGDDRRHAADPDEAAVDAVEVVGGAEAGEVPGLVAAAAFIEDTAAKGKEVLFVATKPQAQEVVRQAAKSTGMPFAVNRWLGGTLTNFATIKRSLDKYRTYLRMEQDGSLAKMHKKEAAAVKREMSRMARNFEGLLEYRELPSAMIVVDTKLEEEVQDRR